MGIAFLSTTSLMCSSMYWQVHVIILNSLLGLYSLTLPDYQPRTLDWLYGLRFDGKQYNNIFKHNFSILKYHYAILLLLTRSFINIHFEKFWYKKDLFVRKYNTQKNVKTLLLYNLIGRKREKNIEKENELSIQLSCFEITKLKHNL